jgi:hypothetical protein
MRMLIPLFLLGLSIGCGEDPKDDTAPPEGDTDTDTDADSDTDADGDTDADTDADTDTDTDVDLESVTITATVTTVSSRDTVTFGLMGSYDDGSEVDVTDVASFASSDDGVLSFYQPYVGQPLDAGTVTVTGSYEGFEDSVDVTVELALATAGDLVINELLADATVDGDPNGDGSTDAVEDEFIEIANASGVSVDLGGVTIVENDWSTYLPRHTFAEGTLLPAGGAVVVFGGGDVSAMSAANVQFFTADNDDPGTPYGLSLLDAGETVKLMAADGKTTIASVSYGTASFDGSVPAGQDESITLDPDVSGTDYVEHSEATGASTDFSPGTFIDGGEFPSPASVFGG